METNLSNKFKKVFALPGFDVYKDPAINHYNFVPTERFLNDNIRYQLAELVEYMETEAEHDNEIIESLKNEVEGLRILKSETVDLANFFRNKFGVDNFGKSWLDMFNSFRNKYKELIGENDVSAG